MRREIRGGGRVGTEFILNSSMLMWLIAIALLATVGCRPRHPPHTPQPLQPAALVLGIENERP
jgi:hypothetical protein